MRMRAGTVSRLRRSTLAAAIVLAAGLAVMSAAAGARPHPHPWCGVEMFGSWTQTERWVWSRLCATDAADLTSRDAPRDRTLSDAFLNTIIEDEPYRSALRGTIFIIGAHFREPLNLEYTSPKYPLWLQRCVFDQDVDFNGMAAPDLSFDGSTFRQGVELENAQISASLEMDSTDNSPLSVAGTVDLQGISVRGHGSMSGRVGNVTLNDADFGSYLDLSATNAASIDMSNIHVGGYLSLSNATARSVTLSGSAIDRSLYIRGASIIKVLLLINARVSSQVVVEGATIYTMTAYGLRAGNQLFVRSNSRIGTLNLSATQTDGDIEIQHVTLTHLALSGASSGGHLKLTYAELKNKCVCDHLHLHGDLDISRTIIRRRADFGYLTTTGNIALSGSGNGERAFGVVNLTSSHADGDLVLAREPDLWRDDGALVLRNASVHAFEDRSDSCADIAAGCPDPWPKTIQLSGFSYEQLGNLSQSMPRGGWMHATSTFRDMSERDVGRWREWLGREPLSTQPYEQLATVLRQLGHPEAATQLLYQERNDELGHASFPRYQLLWLDRAFVGFGYHPYFALFWILGMLLLGVIVLQVSHERRRLAALPSGADRFPLFGLVYSFDALVPLVTLYKPDADVELHGWARYYFFLHRLLGWILASFIVAGIAGLTK